MSYPGYDQLEFDIEQNYNIYDQFAIYQLEMDLVIPQLAGTDENESFDILFDSPNVKKIRFEADGTITTMSTNGFIVFGNYNFGEKIRIKITQNIYSREFDVDINGNYHYSTVILAPILRSIRMSMYSSSADSLAVVDNIVIRDISNKSNTEYFILDGDQYHMLQFPGSDATVCRGFNDFGEVVGQYWIDGVK